MNRASNRIIRSHVYWCSGKVAGYILNGKTKQVTESVFLQLTLELPAERGTQLITIVGQNFFKDPCPIATICVHNKQQQQTWIPQRYHENDEKNNVKSIIKTEYTVYTESLKKRREN